uniref:Uncharacterized protein n=1 Tax=Anguilla anguilla TaxID=7936 RepID=A0A0E9PFH7_ANGAN
MNSRNKDCQSILLICRNSRITQCVFV